MINTTASGIGLKRNYTSVDAISFTKDSVVKVGNDVVQFYVYGQNFLGIRNLYKILDNPPYGKLFTLHDGRLVFVSTYDSKITHLMGSNYATYTLPSDMYAYDAWFSQASDTLILACDVKTIAVFSDVVDVCPASSASATKETGYSTESSPSTKDDGLVYLSSSSCSGSPWVSATGTWTFTEVT